ncbi:MAG: polysaccharide deacetylase family protein [Isosphaeraceae bacterium]|nr:polysaccharide deacetylase family protein [Isosphaeraceae bacterium]
MRIRGMERLRRAAGRLWHQIERRVLILLYHRVAELPSDPFGLAVTPRHFGEHLEVIRRHYQPLALPQLAKLLRRGGSLPPRSVVITFDDGYADNLHHAEPLLERWDCPATVFVTTGYLGQGREFWWDELDRLLLEPGSLPTSFHLSANGDTRLWALDEAAHGSTTEDQAQRRWPDEREPGPRHHLLLAVHEWLRPLPERHRRQALDQLTKLTGRGTPRPTHLPLTLEELHRLDKSGIVDVGAHTVTHPLLAAHPAAIQREEIVQSKCHLEEILGHPVTSFAYPYGTRADYTADTMAIVRDEGFTCTCSNFPAVVRHSCDPFQLPRFVVRNWEGETFTRCLWEWFHA